ncbi:MAG: M20/M25/M40 family metallo-hydrolase [Acidobacteria bacterium]|nr:M20/M25/M40 family metallo-hydrolase [Acidobacteriota bacterium]MBI3472462.1 M20/M25/M40 family metallo-hydrolase [Candidatus Solibacter usitatus]
MNVFELTRALVDIESITGNEEQVGLYLHDYLSRLAERHHGRVERTEVEPGRFNVFAQFGAAPVVTLSTHMDTVPPFFPSSEDEEFIWGRAACDTKGIIACMLKAAEALLDQGPANLGLLFVVGEERNSVGAFHAARQPRGSRYLINGEPTENKLALGSKGALRYEIIAEGRMAHSAYPHLGESAIEKLLDALAGIRRIELPVDPVLGPSTVNIGTLTGGRAPNVIPDYAKAEIFIRLVGDSAATRAAVDRACNGRAVAHKVLEVPAVRLRALPGIETTVVAYTTDIPAFDGAWGEPLLLGPGSIHVAHTLEERVPKRQLLEAVELYQRMVKDLWKQESK